MLLFDKDPNGHKALMVADLIHNDGYPVYFFGHCIRNYFFGKKVTKYSLITTCPGTRIGVLIGQLIGKGFPGFKGISMRVTFDADTSFTITDDETDLEIDIYPFLGMNEVCPKRKDLQLIVTDGVPIISCIYRDAYERPFTIDTIYYDPFKHQIIDMFGGCQDIKQQRLKCVPLRYILTGANNLKRPISKTYEQKLKERPDLLLKSIAISAKYDLINDETINLYNVKNKNLIAQIKPANIRKYLLESITPSGLESLAQDGIIDPIIEDIQYMLECSMPGSENCDVFNHVVQVLDQICIRKDAVNEDLSPALKMATLFHEISRPTQGGDSVGPKSAKIATDYLKALGFSDKFCTQVFNMIFYLNDVRHWTQQDFNEKTKILDKCQFVMEDLVVLALAKDKVEGRNYSNDAAAALAAYRLKKALLITPPVVSAEYFNNHFENATSLPSSRFVDDIRLLQLQGKLSTLAEAERYLLNVPGITRKVKLQLPVPAKNIGKYSSACSTHFMGPQERCGMFGGQMI